MNNISKRIRCTSVVAIVLVLVMVLPVFAVEEYGQNDDDLPRILLAYEKSVFKNALVGALVEELQDTAYIRAVNHSRGELTKEQSADYDAVIIINAGVNSRVRPWVSAWLAEIEDTEKIILFTTYRDRGWSPRYPAGVDSITSPSKKSAVNKLVDTISEKVQELTS